jgi:hypothetical protein
MIEIPRPWKIGKPREDGGTAIRFTITCPDPEMSDTGNWLIADVIGGVMIGDKECDKEIANIIAAAPDLLHALQLVRNFGLHGDTEEGISVSYFVEEALKKARG